MQRWRRKLTRRLWCLFIWIAVILFVTFASGFGDTLRHYLFTSKTPNKINTDFTMVTALFDIGRGKWPPKYRRDIQDYLNISQQLMKLDVPLVIYIEPDLENFYHKLRWGKESYTRIKVMSFSEIKFYKYLDPIRKVMNSSQFLQNNEMLEHAEGLSAEYNVVVCSKAQFLRQAAEENIFNSSYIYWLDVGYGHGNPIFPESWAPNSIMNTDVGDKITILSLIPMDNVTSIDVVYKKDHNPFVIGGFFGGSLEAVKNYSDFYEDTFVDLLNKGVVDDDQTIALACYLDKPEIFNVVNCSSDWNGLFRVIN